MANVDVSTYSLESVSKALTSFKNGIAGFSPNVEKEVSASISECQTSVKCQRDKVNDIKVELQEKEKLLTNCEKAVPRLESDIKTLKDQKKSLLSELEVLKKQLSDLEKQREKNPDNESIQHAIDKIKSMIQSVEHQIELVSSNISTAEQELSKLNNSIEDLKEGISHLKSKLKTETDKLTQMTNLLGEIEHGGKALISEARSLQSDSSDIASHSHSCIDKCLQYLNEYIKS